jgi:hypothetical protein
MDAALSRRLASLFDRSDADIDEREQLIGAAEKVATFDDLPDPAKQLVAVLESRAGQMGRSGG